MQRVWTVISVLAWLAGAPSLLLGDPGPNPVFTNKIHFRIPFRFDPAELQKLDAHEVQLYVSTDHGGHWKMVDRVEPRAEHFDFLAPSDGEYWFAVRTLDAFNRLHPDGDNEPGLKVVVDATPPALELTLTEIEPGKVELRWTAADDHLDPTRLRLEYRQPDSPEWQQVGVVPQASGQTTWMVPGGGIVAVRGTIGDLAGNTASAEKQLNVRGGGSGREKGSETEYRAPVAGDQPPAAPAGAVANAPPNLTPGTGARGPQVTNRVPGDRGLKTDDEFFADASDSGPRIQPRAKQDLISDSPASRPPIVAAPQTSPAGAPSIADRATLDEMDMSNAFPAPSAAMPSGPSPSAAPASSRSQPQDGTPRMILVNNRNFQIGYRVDDVGPSGVGKVELFITQNDGRKWYRYGTDPDNKSPFAVSVPNDGVYGFELRVKNGAGVGDDPPRPGDKPSIVVTVDQIPPTANLLPPQVGRGKSRGKVLLRWTAADEHLGSAPVLLEYAAQPSGPWQKIADWLPNTGRYIWSLDRGLPGKVYVRLTVKDEAGNTTQASIAEPLLIDFTRPTAHIIDIEAKTASQPQN